VEASKIVGVIPRNTKRNKRTKYKPLYMTIRNSRKYFTPVLLDGGIKKSPIGDLNAKYLYT
jgi:hypothetical protein